MFYYQKNAKFTNFIPLVIQSVFSNGKKFKWACTLSKSPLVTHTSLFSRRLEVVGERENGRAWGRHACLLLARPFFLAPTTSKRLLLNTIRYNTIRVYCENTLSYNNGVLSHTEPKSGSVKARQLIYRYSTNTIKLRVKKLDMEYSIIKIITIKS